MQGYIYKYRGQLYCDYDIPETEVNGDLFELLWRLKSDKKTDANMFWKTPLFEEDILEHKLYAKDILAKDFRDLRIGEVSGHFAEWDDGEYHRKAFPINCL